jgi:hypothetical protein
MPLIFRAREFCSSKAFVRFGFGEGASVHAEAIADDFHQAGLGSRTAAACFHPSAIRARTFSD